MIDWTALGVFSALFLLVTVLGFLAARWRRGDLTLLNEWGLGGQRFGTVVTWFLLGGDLYTAYTFVAVPALVFGSGALGLYALPYTIILYPFAFLTMPRLWSVARKHGYITPSDFVMGRYGSSPLSLAVAITGIVATMPYIALQLVGIEVVLGAMGIQGDLPLVIAFVILALYTYFSGLRAPAMIALVKDSIIYLTVLVAIIVIPIKLGGFGHIFGSIPSSKLFLSPAQYPVYATLAFGSALALFMYPHSITGVLASQRRDVVKRNMALLPAYSFLLGVIALLGYMAVVAGVQPHPVYGAQWAVPGLFQMMFPSWFAGFAFAAIAIGALVPASVMSIAAANLFTRNIYKTYFRPDCSGREEATTAKTTSLIVKIGALAFIVFLPTTYAINLQLLGGVWIIQTLPPLVMGLYTRWFHRHALLAGWAVGIAYGTWMALQQGLKSSTYVLPLGGGLPGYAALWALIVNLIVAVVLTLVFKAMQVPDGHDQTSAPDYDEERAAEPTPLLRREPVAPAVTPGVPLS
jgi:solute:Na+ symporter, SSS family